MDVIFWQTVSASTLWAFFGFLIALAFCFWLASRLRKFGERRSSEKNFLSRAARLGIADEEKQELLQLIERQEVTRPVRLLNSLREYDILVTKEILWLFESDMPWAVKLRCIDHFYSVREKLFGQEFVSESSTLFRRRSS